MSKTKPSIQRSVISEEKFVYYCCRVAGHKKHFVSRYKDLKICELCARGGHFKKVCKAKGKLGNVNVLKQMAEILNDDLNMENLFNLEVPDFNFIKPFNVEMLN